MRRQIYRLPLLILGAMMLILGIANPTQVETTGQLNGDIASAVSIYGGQSLTVLLDLGGTSDEMALTVKNAGSGRNMTLSLQAVQQDGVLAKDSFPMAKTRPSSKLKLALPEPVKGQVALQVHAEGEGEVALQANAEGQLAVWGKLNTVRYGLAWIWCGALLMLISLVPVWEKGGKRHA